MIISEWVDLSIRINWTNSLNVIVLGEVEVPEPTAEGATAVVRNTTQNLQQV